MAHLKQQDVVPWCLEELMFIVLPSEGNTVKYAPLISSCQCLLFKFITKYRRSIEYFVMDYDRCRSAATKIDDLNSMVLPEVML